MPMRRVLITLLCGLVVAPAALAAGRAVGDGVLELRAVYGTVQIGSVQTPARGALWGQMDKGTLSVIDPIVGDGAVFVSGYETKNRYDLPSGYTKWVYGGKNLHFRVTGGKYKLTFAGSGIDVTAVGIGIAYLNGDEDALDAGDYAVDGGKWLPVPVTFAAPQQARAVTFGDPTATTP
jgi:hypothetical protein